MATKRIRVATTYQSDKDIDRLRREVDSLILQLNDVLQRLDHGDIAGLDDDDHEQYHNDDRGDARYFREDEHIDVSAGAGDAGKPIVLDVDGKIDASMIDYTDVTDDILSNSIPAVSLASSGGSGSAEEASRSDHRHQVSTATAVSVGTTNAVGTSSALARADHTHAVTGLSIASQTAGDILYFNGASWIRTAIGTEGEVLTSASSTPQWLFPTPVGAIIMWGTGTPPARWELCDGSAISRSVFADLFAVIGETFGAGNGTTTFNLPDFDGRIPMGVGTSPAPTSIGATAGNSIHQHTLGDDAWAQIVNSVSAGDIYLRRVTATSWSPTHEATLASATSVAGPFTSAVALDGATDNGSTIPPVLGVHFIIYSGVT